MFRLSTLYYVWVIFNCVLFWMSGYIQSVAKYLKKFPIIDESWDVFFESSGDLYLINNFEITSYDITEYTIAVVFPLFVYYLIKSFHKPKYNKNFTFDD